MKKALVLILVVSVPLGAFVVVSTQDAQESSSSSPDSIRFGMDAASIDTQSEARVEPDYGTFWVGPWTLESGWGGPGATMDSMRERGVTPAIHYYYWGDDISPSCVEDGCWSDLHNTHKDREGWQQLAEELVEHLETHMGGEPVMVFMETEFNKGGIETYEPFDGYLAQKARYIKEHYPAAEIVMALGNWGRHNWSNFDEAAQASDSIGIQGMRGSTRDDVREYRSIYEDTVQALDKIQELFDKPVVIQDIALSSHPEPEYLEHQSAALEDFFEGLDRLKDGGLQAMIYRAWFDDPYKNKENYYGEAERHFGLTWGRDSELKPAGKVWVNGVQAERAGKPYEPPTEAELQADFRVAEDVNEWWVEVYVDSSTMVTHVEARADEGKWQGLDWTDWGSWAKSFEVPAGSQVVFRATAPDGQSVTSETFTWMHETFDADFSPKWQDNNWWIEVEVDSPEKIRRVEACIERQDECKPLAETDWDSWGESYHAPKGSQVHFVATSASGAKSESATYTWG